MLSKFLQVEAAKAPDVTKEILSEDECHRFWPIATLILRACGDGTLQTKQALDGKLAVTVTKLGTTFTYFAIYHANLWPVFQDSATQFQQSFGPPVFLQLMERAVYSIPPIPPQSHSLSPLSSAHLLKIELLKLATIVLKSTKLPGPELGNRYLGWIHTELNTHIKESQHTYLTTRVRSPTVQ